MPDGERRPIIGHWISFGLVWFIVNCLSYAPFGSLTRRAFWAILFCSVIFGFLMAVANSIGWIDRINERLANHWFDKGQR